MLQPIWRKPRPSLIESGKDALEVGIVRVLIIPKYCVRDVIRELKHPGMLSICKIWDVDNVPEIAFVPRAGGLKLTDQ